MTTTTPDIVLQVTDASGEVVLTSLPLSDPLPTSDDEVLLPGSDQRYVVETDAAGDDYVVSVAASLEDVDESTQALVPLLADRRCRWCCWWSAARPGSWSGGPCGRWSGSAARSQTISDERLDRRVPVPGGRDELHRLALTMNEMLERLHASRDRQQRFVSDASHELRSPLASIRQAAEVARTPSRSPAGGRAGGRGAPGVGPDAADRGADAGAHPHRRARPPRPARGGSRRPRARRGGAGASGGSDRGRLGRGRRPGGRRRASRSSQVVRNLVDNAARHAQVAGRAHRAPSRMAGWSCASTTTATASRRRSGSASSSGSSGSTRPAARDAGGSGLGLAIVREIVARPRRHGARDRFGLGGALVRRLPAATSGAFR